MVNPKNNIAFFSRISGGPERGIQFLSDSNLDWGQGLKELAAFCKKEGNPELLLSYFGTAVPAYYGMIYEPLPTVWSFPKSQHLNSVVPEKEWLAVSATNLQGTYFGKHDLYRWLLQKEPIAKIGYSIYVYDVTHDLESAQKILEIYELAGMEAAWRKQSERVRRMQAK